MRVWGWVRRYPWLLGALSLVAAWLLVRPFGNYPLNDDWVYARVSLTLATTGIFRVPDTGSTTNLLGQALVAAPLIRLLGFSHVLLRCISLGLALFGLWLMDSLLRHGRGTASARALCSVVVAVNPLYLYFATTFMNELYGWVPALGAAALWFWGRGRRNVSQGIVSPYIAGAVGLLAGSTFWTRQFCVVIFPALVAGSLLPLLLDRQWARLWASTWSVLLGTGAFVAAILSYFAWARASGNLRPEFVKPLGALSQLDLPLTLIHAGSLVMYLTAFLAPLLVFLAWKGGGQKNALLGVSLLGLVLLTHIGLQKIATTDDGLGNSLHRHFPYLGNVLYNAGIGPLNLDDVALYRGARPQWPGWTWEAVELILGGLVLLWVPFLRSAWGLLRHEEGPRREVLGFGLMLALLNFAVVTQAFKAHTYERYFFPCVLGIAVAVGVMMETRSTRVRGERGWLFFALWLPVVFYAIGGVHDEFRWNDPRWRWVSELVHGGIDPFQIAAGYEVAGWYSTEPGRTVRLPEHCIGACGCRFEGSGCVDDSYRIGMNVFPGYRVLKSEQPRYWLTSGPSVTLSVRRPLGSRALEAPAKSR